MLSNNQPEIAKIYSFFSSLSSHFHCSVKWFKVKVKIPFLTKNAAAWLPCTSLQFFVIICHKVFKRLRHYRTTNSHSTLLLRVKFAHFIHFRMHCQKIHCLFTDEALDLCVACHFSYMCTTLMFHFCFVDFHRPVQMNTDHFHAISFLWV